MVRSYKRKTTRGEWSKESMKNAVEKVLSSEMGYRKAALEYKVPQTTLERHVKAIRIKGEMKLDLPLGPIKTVFSYEEENELVKYLKEMEARLFGLTTLELRSLAYQLAVKNCKVHKFNPTNKMAGVDWVQGFLKRHQDLSIRKPEATSAARAMGFNKVSVAKFYGLLGEVLDKYKLGPDRIYNCDETGVSSVSKTKSKIISRKGRKQVGSLSSAERGQTITVEICVSAAGIYMPPTLIFPRKRMKAELLNNSAPGTTSYCNSSGWMTTDIFVLWFKRFIQFSGASKDNPVLLLLDGHATHTKNIELIDLARENGVVIICFPPHCTHRLQPLDVSFMKPLSIYYDQAATAWLRSNPGRVISMFQISEIFGKAFIKAATMSTAINGFRKCGIWPFNSENFSDADFLAAETTNIIITEEEQVPQPHDTVIPSTSHQVLPESHSNLNNIVTSSANSYHLSELPSTSFGTCIQPNINNVRPATISESSDDDNLPLNMLAAAHSSLNAIPTETTPPSRESPCKSAILQSPLKHVSRNLNSIFEHCCPAEVLSIPSVEVKAKRKNSRRGKTAILTSTPYKRELEDCKNNATLKENKKPKVAGKKKKTNGKDAPITTAEDDTDCLFCGENYLDSTEGWIACQMCQKWSHNSCAGIEEDDPIETGYTCDICK